ncbi:MAG: hypothetical protein U0V64_10180 [Cyclobacteriaceae bacterium]
MIKWKRVLRTTLFTILIVLALIGVPLMLPSGREKYLHKRTQREWVSQEEDEED